MHFNKGKAYGRQGKAPTRLIFQHSILCSTLHRRHIDPKWTFKKVMETQKELKDTERFDWLESTELAIDKRKFLLNRLYQRQPIPQDED